MGKLLPGGYLIKDRKLEICLGLVFFAIGAVLIYDAFDRRGKKVPWPVGAIFPW